MSFRLGITGGIGSGKSTVCKVFNVLGIPVFYSDDVARSIMEENSELKKELNSLLGFDIYSKGKLDRPELARLIFNNTRLLEKVNRLVHPYVFNAFDQWAEKQDTAFVILEAAILFESGSDRLTDRVLAVIAPVEERIQRVMGRNEMTREQVIERIRNQITEEEMVAKSDFIVDNSENQMVVPQILRIYNDILIELKRR